MMLPWSRLVVLVRNFPCLRQRFSSVVAFLAVTTLVSKRPVISRGDSVVESEGLGLSSFSVTLPLGDCLHGRGFLHDQLWGDYFITIVCLTVVYLLLRRNTLALRGVDLLSALTEVQQLIMSWFVYSLWELWF
ncbi:hypothetical protein OIU76_026504 [Salix suchowensis]|nr:hypothetical protein OIU76_026504 [Salix suchowensis]